MRPNEVDFLKGHMGGNEIILLIGSQVPEGKELGSALSVLESPGIRGHQAGLLYESEVENRVRFRIVSVSMKDFISACGGLTQVFGRALLVTDFVDPFDVNIEKPVTKVSLVTDSGLIPLEIENKEGARGRTLTSMNSFVEESYALGVGKVELEGVEAYRVGNALVARQKEIEEKYPRVKLDEMGEYTRKTLYSIQKSFIEKLKLENKSTTFSVYSLNTERGNHARVIFPHHIPTGHIEPACGTGTTAAGIAMLEKGEIGGGENKYKLLFESGGSRKSIGGPELTELQLTVENGEIEHACFSHNLVKILATGKVWV